jgi:hypothetical protein
LLLLEDLLSGLEDDPHLGDSLKIIKNFLMNNLEPYFPITSNFSTSTLIKEPLDIMRKLSLGTTLSKSGDITTIEWYILVALVPLKKLAKKI